MKFGKMKMKRKNEDKKIEEKEIICNLPIKQNSKKNDEKEKGQKEEKK